jgi:hypothetical protein
MRRSILKYSFLCKNIFLSLLRRVLTFFKKLDEKIVFYEKEYRKNFFYLISFLIVAILTFLLLSWINFFPDEIKDFLNFLISSVALAMAIFLKDIFYDIYKNLIMDFWVRRVFYWYWLVLFLFIWYLYSIGKTILTKIFLYLNKNA